MARTHEVPAALRMWFVVHFAADVVFALPMLLAPVWFLGLFGWTDVDPVATRLVAAALFGIGIESLLGRNQGLEAFSGMLDLKIIWSTSAILGFVLSILEGAPWGTWIFLAQGRA